MNTRHRKLKLWATLAVAAGLVMVVIGSGLTAGHSIRLAVIATFLLYVGQALFLGGIVLGGMAVMVRREPAYDDEETGV